jgi:hypothetical protein
MLVAPARSNAMTSGRRVEHVQKEIGSARGLAPSCGSKLHGEVTDLRSRENPGGVQS